MKCHKLQCSSINSQSYIDPIFSVFIRKSCNITSLHAGNQGNQKQSIRCGFVRQFYWLSHKDNLLTAPSGVKTQLLTKAVNGS